MHLVLLRLVIFIGVIIFCTHFYACAWYFTTNISSPPDSWTFRLKVEDNPMSKLYLYSLYWAVTTLATVGYGDITARSKCKLSFAYLIAEYTIAILWIFFGSSFYSFLIGSMSSLLRAIETKQAMLLEKFQMLSEFCETVGINSVLKEKLGRAIEHRSLNYFYSLFENNTIYEQLPEKLKYRVTLSDI